MKRFLILILFSLFFPIQNSSAVSPTLDETIEFLTNAGLKNKSEWSIKECVLTTYFTVEESKKYTNGEYRVYEIVDLNKVNLNASVKHDETSFTAYCEGDCVKIWNINSESYEMRNKWININVVEWKRNQKALSHLYSNFCTGFKPAF
jgi:hypothetical protein|tara:strand:- start:125 stop:568 length:444 start_codon:yes stop_codon:yes gene_type:complete